MTFHKFHRFFFRKNVSLSAIRQKYRGKIHKLQPALPFIDNPAAGEYNIFDLK